MSRTTYNTAMLQDRINGLIERHNSLRNAAKIIGVTPAYISRLRNGGKLNPSDKILRKLGLTRMIIFLDDGSNDK